MVNETYIRTLCFLKLGINTDSLGQDCDDDVQHWFGMF